MILSFGMYLSYTLISQVEYYLVKCTCKQIKYMALMHKLICKSLIETSQLYDNGEQKLWEPIGLERLLDTISRTYTDKNSYGKLFETLAIEINT